MSQENLEKARDFIAAYNRRDFDAAVESFDPEIEWVLPDRQSSDSCRGPDEVKRFWRGLDETMEELRLEPQEFVDAGDYVATRLRHYGIGRRSGVEIDEEMYHQVVTFRAGRMVRIEYFGEWSEALEAVGLSEYTMSQGNEERVRRGYEALNRGELRPESFGAEFEIVEPPEQPGAETRHGPKGVSDSMTALTEAFDNLQYQPERLV